MTSNTGTHIPDRGPTVLAATCAVSVLSTLFVLLRGISRIVIVRHIGSDDYWMFVAWVSCSFSYRRFKRLIIEPKGGEWGFCRKLWNSADFQLAVCHGIVRGNYGRH